MATFPDTREATVGVGAARVRDQAAHERLGLADREALLGNQRADLRLLLRHRQREQGAGVAHLELALLDEWPDRLRQVEQAQEV